MNKSLVRLYLSTQKLQKELEMDFSGQRLADILSTVMLWTGAAVAFIVGFTLKDFELMIQTFGGFVVLTLLIVVPDWPFYNKHPIQWSTASRIEADGTSDSNSSESASQQKRKKQSS